MLSPHTPIVSTYHVVSCCPCCFFDATPLQEAGLPVGLLLMMQRLVAATTPAAAAAAALPEGKTPKKGKKQQQPAAAVAAPDAAAAADEAEWLPDLMAALAEQVRGGGRVEFGALLHGCFLLRSTEDAQA